MPQESMQPQIGDEKNISKGISRRDFLKLGALAGSALLAELAAYTGPAYTLEYLDLLKDDKLANKCNEYIGSHESLRQYKVIRCAGLPPRTDEYALIIQNPSSGSDKYRFAFSEGETPTFCLINEDGVCDYSKLSEMILPENIENIGDSTFANQDVLRNVEVTQSVESSPVGKETILILGDSWTRWNGLEASYPAMLQTLCDVSGKNIRIVDASSTSTGVADYRYQYDRLKAKYKPNSVLWSFHPNTDVRFDAKRANVDVETQVSSIGEVGGLQDPSPMTHAATNLLRKWESDNLDFYTTLKSLAKKFVKGKLSDALVTDNELLSYIGQVKDFGGDLSKDSVKSILIGIPPHDLGKFDEGRYSDIWRQITDAQSELGGQFANAKNAFKSKDFDEYNHPTFVGSLKLAIISYFQIFGEKPTDDVIEKVVEVHKKRRQQLDAFRKAILSS